MYEPIPTLIIPIIIVSWYYGSKLSVTMLFGYIISSRSFFFLVINDGQDFQILSNFVQQGLSYFIAGTIIAILVGELGKINNKLQDSVQETKKLNLELEVYNEELRATNDQLETTIQELKFANTELEIMNVLIEKEKTKQESFFSHTIHDLKSSVRGISFIISMLEKRSKEQGKDKKSDDLVERLSNTNKHLIGLTQDLLDLSKLERLEYQIEPQWVTSMELFAFLKNLEITIKEEGREYHETIDEEIKQLKIFIDEKRYQQVINNLVNNAIKFSDQNDIIELVVNFKKINSGNIFLETIVKDTGKGIRPEMQNKIFDQYYQGDGHGKSGYGLGLTIVKKIIDLMEGEIKLNSKPEEGSEFIITIPLQAEKLSSEIVQ